MQTPHPPGYPAPPPPAASAPAYYVPVPRRLVEDLRDAPVALGAYALVARRFRISPAPVPLSAADLRLIDPALSYGAATRALQRLVAAGYLIPAGDASRKRAYTPAWGTVAGRPAPWRPDAPCLGRPRHVAALRLDQRILDTCVGRVSPHPHHPAQVARYTTAPLLGLADVGAFTLALAGLPAPAAPALAAIGLLNPAGAPRPLPDDATLLALASQRAAADPGAPQISPAGWARTAFQPPAGQPPAAPAPVAGQPLFFVPRDLIAPMIGHLIADPITRAEPGQSLNLAPERHEPPPAPPTPGSHGVHGADRVHPTTTPQGPTGQGGGGALASAERPGTGTRGHGDTIVAPASPTPPTETERQLLGIGVRREVARALADRPAALVAQVIAQTTARPGVRDRAAWVVSALRALPDAPADAPALPPPSPMPIYTHPALADEQRDRWIRRFHAATGPAEKRAVLARMAQEHPLPDGARLPAGSDAPPDRGPAPATPG